MIFSKRLTTLALLMLCSSLSQAQQVPTRACPLTCTGPTGAARFCNLIVQDRINAASLCVTGPVQFGSTLELCGQEHIFSTGVSSSCTTGALVVDGGVGIGGNLNVCGQEHIFSTGVSSNCTTGALVVDGGVGIGGNLYVCGLERVTNTTASTGCTNGALVVSGGVGVGGNLNVCGTEHIFSTGASTSCTTGALVVDGGVGVGGNLTVCGTISASGPVSFAPIIPFGATVAVGALDLLGADIGFGIAQSLAVLDTDLLSFTASRAAVLSNLAVNASAFVSLGDITAQIYVSTDSGATWTPSGITVTITGDGPFADNVNTFAVPAGAMIALRVSSVVLGATVALSAGLQFN